MDTFLKTLENTCPGDDAHDGLGDPRPLLERCSMCRTLHAAHVDAMSALREIAKHAARVARGDEDAAKLAELLDATGDPELMYTR